MELACWTDQKFPTLPAAICLRAYGVAVPPARTSSPSTMLATSPGDSSEHGPNLYFAVMLVLVAAWLFTGAGHFWPLYPALGWGLPLLMGRRSAVTAPARLTPASQSGPR